MMGMSDFATSLIEAPTVTRAAPALTVVVPCYNERANVAPLIARLDAALYGIAWEVVYVDDDSPDGTAAEVRRIAQTDRRVRCIRRIGRRGLASAVIEGALSSSAQYIAVIDGDLQHDETKLPNMLAALRSGQRTSQWAAATSTGATPPASPVAGAIAYRRAESGWRRSSCRYGSPIR